MKNNRSTYSYWRLRVNDTRYAHLSDDDLDEYQVCEKYYPSNVYSRNDVILLSAYESEMYKMVNGHRPIIRIDFVSSDKEKKNFYS